jgi:FO synthase
MARKGPTTREAILMHSVARLVLHPLITNIQTSWVKMGPEGAALCLNAGANDMGGTLMNESISRAAGTQHGQEFPPEAMETLIHGVGRHPVQRSTAYGGVSNERQIVSFNAPELAPVVQTPPRKVLVGE